MAVFFLVKSKAPLPVPWSKNLETLSLADIALSHENSIQVHLVVMARICFGLSQKFQQKPCTLLLTHRELSFCLLHGQATYQPTDNIQLSMRDLHLS
jgi:hypothetical protein